jgi:hypothetical protein
MDLELEAKYQNVLQQLKQDLGEKPDMNAVIFLIGVQELGKGYMEFSKQQKLELMHIAVCRLLEPYGFYQFDGNDNEGWPHYINIKKLPSLDERQQQNLMKQAIVDYFTE